MNTMTVTNQDGELVKIYTDVQDYQIQHGPTLVVTTVNGIYMIVMAPGWQVDIAQRQD